MQHMDEALRAHTESRLHELVLEHRDLDTAIEQIQHSPDADELAVRRMKRRKLLLKDQIARLVRELDPDVPA